MTGPWESLFAGRGDEPAVSEGDRTVSYAELAERVGAAAERFAAQGVGAGSVVLLHADFSAASIAAFFALARLRAILIPRVNLTADGLALARAEHGVQFLCRAEPGCRVERLEGGLEVVPPPALYAALARRGAAGLVLLTSGSSGKPKAILHDLDRLREARLGRPARRRLVTVLFLLFDHIGGINTLLTSLASGGKAIVVPERTPEAVCELVERHRASVLPASPSFLGLILLAGLPERLDLGSLRLITYGTEPMPEGLLRRVRAAFPRARLLQTFGTSETGIAATRSESSASTRFKIAGGEVEHRVVDGELQLRSATQFLGYLDLPPGGPLDGPQDALTEDGWFRTGDLVEETEGGFLRIRGRAREVINVGGAKVLPAEVESLLLESSWIADCAVYGEANALTGQAVCADIVPRGAATRAELRRHIHELLVGRVDRFKIPSRIQIVAAVARSERFKKRRTP